MFSNNRAELRQAYFDTWKAYQNKQTLTPLQQQILQVIIDHPEYHDLLSFPDRYQDRDYLPEFGETNPFLHMGLHLGIREQVATNRPEGIRTIFQKQCQTHKPLEAEHHMMDALVETLWQAQRKGTAPDEHHYLTLLSQ